MRGTGHPRIEHPSEGNATDRETRLARPTWSDCLHAILGVFHCHFLIHLSCLTARSHPSKLKLIITAYCRPVDRILKFSRSVTRTAKPPMTNWPRMCFPLAGRKQFTSSGWVSPVTRRLGGQCCSAQALGDVKRQRRKRNSKVYR